MERGSLHMAGGLDRVVERIQRRQRSRMVGIGPADLATPHEIAELQDRVRRLHALGVQYDHVRLSNEVARDGAAHVSVQVRGKCVATEV